MDVFRFARGRLCRERGSGQPSFRSLRLCGELPLVLVPVVLILYAFSACGLAGESGGRKNLLLVTIDTLRADRIGAYGWEKAGTPTLDRLAQQGKIFLDVFTSVPVTLPAHATLFTGRLPFRHGVRGNSFYTLPAEEVTLAEVLQEEGYQTAAVVGSVVLDSRFGLDQGFAFYDDEIADSGKLVQIAERRAEEVTRRAVEWLHGSDPSRPFFLWVHYFDPHAPYAPPAEFAGRTGSSYQDEIAYTDRQLGVLLQALEERKLAGNTVKVVTSDHGEGLGEHGEQSHGIFLYDSTLRVPLLVAGPGVAPGIEEPPAPRALVDLMPTILVLLGLPAANNLDGIGLFGSSEGPAFQYAETFMPRDFYGWSELQALRSQDRKFIQAPQPELYDLQSDPAELHNLAAQDPGTVESLTEELDRLHSESLRNASAADTQEELDSDLLEQLRSLGYVGITKPVENSGRENRPRPDPKKRIHLVEEIDKALLLVQNDRLPEAVTQLRSTLEADPGNYVVVHTLADALFDLKRDREAVEAYQQAIQVGPEAAYYHNRLAVLYGRLGEHEKAAVHFLEIIRRDPEVSQTVLKKADSLLRAGEPQGARAYLEALEAAGAGGAALEVRFAELWLAQGEIDKAIGRLERALDSDPRNPALLRAKGQALRALGTQRGEKGDYAAAAEALETALSLIPGDFETLYNLGITRLRMGQIDSGVQSLRQALEQRPGEIRILNLVAEVHLRQGDYPAALEYLKESLRLNPDQPAVRHNLKAVQEKLDQPPKE